MKKITVKDIVKKRSVEDRSEHKLEKILIIPDCHHPYCDKNAWELMLKAARGFKPDHCIILGDFADFFDVSFHSKEVDRRFKLKEEMDSAKAALSQVVSLGAKNNVFIEGNHEFRLQRYVEQNAPELHKVINVPNLLGLKERGFHYVPYKDSYKIGKLFLTHDANNAGRTANLKALDTFQKNIVIGHTHRMAYAVEGNANGDRHVGCSFGWLGDAEAATYMHKIKALRDWTLGFGIGYLDTNTGVVYLVPVPIVKNTCLVEGRLISL